MGACFGNQHRKVIIIEMGPDQEKSSFKEKLRKLGEMDSNNFDKELRNICEKVKDSKETMEINCIDDPHKRQSLRQHIEQLDQISKYCKSNRVNTNILPDMNEVIEDFKICNTENKSYCI